LSVHLERLFIADVILKALRKHIGVCQKNTSSITKNLFNFIYLYLYLFIFIYIYIKLFIYLYINTFENLEAMCKKLFPDNTYYTVSTRKKNLLDSPLQNMTNISRTCKNRVTCLENSPNIHEQIKKAGISYISDSVLYMINHLKAQNLERRY